MVGIYDFGKRIFDDNGDFTSTDLVEKLEGGVMLFSTKEEAQAYIDENGMDAKVVFNVTQNPDGTCSYRERE